MPSGRLPDGTQSFLSRTPTLMVDGNAVHTGTPLRGTPLAVSASPLTGRSYHSTCDLPAGTCVLDVPTPYTCTVYKQFRNEVCAECWKYDGGRRSFLTRREHGEAAGLSFCDTQCRDAWIAREGNEMFDLLSTLESARRKKITQKQTGQDVVGMGALTEDGIEKAWKAVEQQATIGSAKVIRRWRDLQLDDFQADLARYVLMALYHYAQELAAQDNHASDADTCGPSCAALWSNFASLQSGEARQVIKFPELLDDHIRIFHVLKGRFGIHEATSQSAALDRLADVVTTENVRVALGVDPGNSFGIWEVPVVEESEGLGFGVYPIPSFFNHHCSPNVRKERFGRRLRFVTTRATVAGDELCISYGHVESMSWAERQKELHDGWFFDCRCSRCIEEMPRI